MLYLDLDPDTYKLSFTSQGNGTTSYDTLIDNVSVVAVSSVPLPAAIWMFSSALVGLLGFTRLKSTQQ
jgi:hypothetical protein